MTRDEFSALVEEALDSIPERFSRHVRNVGFVIEDEPSEDLLDEMDIDPDDTLLGLYQGTPLTERGWDHGNQLPDKITLFQFPIEDDGNGSDDDILDAIGETLIHEVGHFFGMTEEQIDVVEEMWRLGKTDDAAGEGPADESA